MASKNAVSDWSETPNSNDNVAGINIAENCAAANLNNAIRTVMAQIKSYSLTAEPGLVYSLKNADYTAVLTDKNKFFRFTDTSTLNLTAAAALGSGWHCWVLAMGANVIIEPNGSELINGVANITINSGNSAFITCSGTAFYAVTIPTQEFADQKLNKLQPYVDVASEATTNIAAVDSQNLFITGTTTITSFGSATAGVVRNLVFAGALILTNSGSLILPNGTNITTVAGESLRAVCNGGSSWRVTEYQRKAVPTLTAGNGLSATGTIAGGNMSIGLDIYTGSSASQTVFPVGHKISVFIDAVKARNALVVPALHDSDTRYYVISTDASAGTSLSGTWRSRGCSDTGGKFYDVERVA